MTKTLEMVIEGAKKFKKALSKFFTDSQLINEIYDRIDKEIFFPATMSENYKHIEDVAENDIYDSFIESCIVNIYDKKDVTAFVMENYSNKSKEAQKYIITFFTQIYDLVFDILKRKASPETMLIIKGQEIATATIIEQLATSNKQKDLETESIVIIKYCRNTPGFNWTISQTAYNIANKKITKVVNLSPNKSMTSNESIFWDIEKQDLINSFNKKLTSKRPTEYPLYICALAPIPLLILLGNLFSTYTNTHILQLHKDSNSYNWNHFEAHLDVSIDYRFFSNNVDEIALVMSFSGKVNLQNVSKSIGTDMSIVEMSISNPYDDFLKTKSQLDEFENEYRKAKEYIASKGIKRIHLFAAIPVAFALAIGRDYNPNYDATIITYNYKRGNYTKAITIGE